MARPFTKAAGSGARRAPVRGSGDGAEIFGEVRTPTGGACDGTGGPATVCGVPDQQSGRASFRFDQAGSASKSRDEETDPPSAGDARRITAGLQLWDRAGKQSRF